MKHLYILFFVFAFAISAQAQEQQLKQTEIKGDLVEVTLYYDTGEIMQHGFYNKEGELHGGWESYNKAGEMTCYATYNHGVKIGVWTYWHEKEITKVTYDRNEVIDLKVFKKNSFLKNEF